MSDYQNAGVGLRKMYVATIGIVVCMLFSFVPLVGILFEIGSIVFGVMSLIGCYYAGKDIVACKIAFVLQIASVLFGVVGVLNIAPELVAALCSLADEVCGTIAVCLVYISVSKVLRKNGAHETARQGNVALCLELVGSLILIVSGGLVLTGNTLLALLIMLAFSILGLVYQLKFLKNSAEEFGVYF